MRSKISTADPDYKAKPADRIRLWIAMSLTYLEAIETLPAYLNGYKSEVRIDVNGRLAVAKEQLALLGKGKPLRDDYAGWLALPQTEDHLTFYRFLGRPVPPELQPPAPTLH